MKITKDYLIKIIKEELGATAVTSPAETAAPDAKKDIANQVRGNPQVKYLQNREDVEKALQWYFQSTSTPAALNALNFVLGWLGSKRG